MEATSSSSADGEIIAVEMERETAQILASFVRRQMDMASDLAAMPSFANTQLLHEARDSIVGDLDPALRALQKALHDG